METVNIQPGSGLDWQEPSEAGGPHQVSFFPWKVEMTFATRFCRGEEKKKLGPFHSVLHLSY